MPCYVRFIETDPQDLSPPDSRARKERTKKMNVPRDLERRSFFKGVFGCAVLVGMMTLSGSPPAQADDDCQRRIVKADHNLHEAAERHGWSSKQAERWRHELQKAREYCWEHNHRWWDEDERRWHTERDWDDHDRDRERPRPNA